MKKVKVLINGQLEYLCLTCHDYTGYHYNISGTTTFYTFCVALHNVTKGFNIENEGLLFTIL